MKIASWNVNSVKARLPILLSWLQQMQPDILLLQETKTIDESFPKEPIADLGYEIATYGQKSYNGVAILARQTIEDVLYGLPYGSDDNQARYIEAVIGGVVRVASIYLPNGNPVPGAKYDYKLAWMDRLQKHVAARLSWEEKLVLGGDYNIIPQALDCHDPDAWAGDALFRAETRQNYWKLLGLGLTDAYRACHPLQAAYSFWDYQGGAWAKDHGVRIDHLLLSPQAADCLSAAGIDKQPRGEPKASDHTPVWCDLIL